MRDEMKRTMFELFGVGSEDDKVLAAGGKKPAVKPEPVKTAPVQAPVQPVVKAKAASYLAAGTSLEGTLRSDGDVEIAGAFKGEVITTGTVTLRSVIQSNITAGSLNLIGWGVG
ncbi:unknown [Firmicutes bacterium CAG:176]|nr:unknown [Firmicutes bacterium CAG:176]